MLHATEAFGTGAYFIRPGQRVLFEHGSLREVVDRETSNCGCPKPDRARTRRQRASTATARLPEAVTQQSVSRSGEPGPGPPTRPQQTRAAWECKHRSAAGLAYDGTNEHSQRASGRSHHGSHPPLLTRGTPAPWTSGAEQHDVIADPDPAAISDAAPLNLRVRLVPTSRIQRGPPAGPNPILQQRSVLSATGADYFNTPRAVACVFL